MFKKFKKPNKLIVIKERETGTPTRIVSLAIVSPLWDNFSQDWKKEDIYLATDRPEDREKFIKLLPTVGEVEHYY